MPYICNRISVVIKNAQNVLGKRKNNPTCRSLAQLSTSNGSIHLR